MNPKSIILMMQKWTPARLFSAGEPGYWFDPSDLSTMWQDSAGTTPVTAAGQPVGRILDKSGRGNHAVQATAGSRPTLSLDAGGRYYLAFDGIATSLSIATLDLTAVDKIFVCAGVAKTSDAGVAIVCEHGTTGSENGSFTLYAPKTAGTGDYGFRSRGTTAVTPTSANSYPSPNTSVLCGIGDIPNASAILRVNGGVVATINTTQGTGKLTSRGHYIGGRAGTTLPLKGSLYGIFASGSIPNDMRVGSAERWMAARAGI